MKSGILVFMQFFIIFLMLLPLGSDTSHPNIGSFLVVIGLSIGALALYKNRLGNFNIRPDIKEDASLVSDGIYSYIRHPMYTSVLVSMLGIVFLYFNIFEIILYLILFLNMLIKMFYEESLWMKKSDEYKEYSKTTYRLVPFIL